MSDSTDVHKRIDTILDRLAELHTDVKVIKEASSRRDAACLAHNRRTDELDISLRGNGKKGILVRLNVVEQRSSGKEKFAYLIIGALVTGLFSLGVILVVKLAS